MWNLSMSGYPSLFQIDCYYKKKISSLFFHLHNHQLLMFHIVLWDTLWHLPKRSRSTNQQQILNSAGIARQILMKSLLILKTERTFKESAFETFPKCVQKKADYDNPEFV